MLLSLTTQLVDTANPAGIPIKVKVSQNQQKRSRKNAVRNKGDFTIFADDTPKATIVHELDMEAQDTRYHAEKATATSATIEDLSVGNCKKHEVERAPELRVLKISYSSVTNASSKMPVITSSSSGMISHPSQRIPSETSNSASSSRQVSSTFSDGSSKSSKSWASTAASFSAAPKVIKVAAVRSVGRFSNVKDVLPSFDIARSHSNNTRVATTKATSTATSTVVSSLGKSTDQKPNIEDDSKTWTTVSSKKPKRITSTQIPEQISEVLPASDTIPKLSRRQKKKLAKEERESKAEATTKATSKVPGPTKEIAQDVSKKQETAWTTITSKKNDHKVVFKQKPIAIEPKTAFSTKFEPATSSKAVKAPSLLSDQDFSRLGTPKSVPIEQVKKASSTMPAAPERSAPKLATHIARNLDAVGLSNNFTQLTGFAYDALMAEWIVDSDEYMEQLKAMVASGSIATTEQYNTVQSVPVVASKKAKKSRAQRRKERELKKMQDLRAAADASVSTTSADNPAIPTELSRSAEPEYHETASIQASSELPAVTDSGDSKSTFDASSHFADTSISPAARSDEPNRLQSDAKLPSTADSARTQSLSMPFDHKSLSSMATLKATLAPAADADEAIATADGDNFTILDTCTKDLNEPDVQESLIPVETRLEDVLVSEVNFTPERIPALCSHEERSPAHEVSADVASDHLEQALYDTGVDVPDDTIKHLSDMVMTESRFCLQHGYQDMVDDADEIKAVATAAESVGCIMDMEMSESRFDLQHGFQDIIDGNEVVPASDLAADPTWYLADTDMTQSRLCLHHGFQNKVDVTDQMPVSGMTDFETLQVGPIAEADVAELDDAMLRLCDIVHAEVVVEHDIVGKVTTDDMLALRYRSIYGYEELRETNVEDMMSAMKSLQDGQRSTTTMNKSVADAVVVELKDHVKTTAKAQATSFEVRAHQLSMGSISVHDFLEELAGANTKNNKYTKDQVTKVFLSYPKRECEMCGLQPSVGTSQPRNTLKPSTLKHLVRLGHTKLVDFIDLVNFEQGVATLPTVAAACIMASENEFALRQSDVGKKVTRALCILAEKKE